MKLLRRLLVSFVTLAATVHAEATQWVYLTNARDVSYSVDMDSVGAGAGGYVEYIARTLWKVPAMLSGTTQPVAASVTRNQIDCANKAWRTVDTHYLTGDGASAGTLHPRDPAWAPIGPGTVVDLMLAKVC
jgi:hypothetical protein